MTYRITDDAGFLIAEIRFHNRTHEDLVAVYLQDVCEVLGAAGYHPVTEEKEAHDPNDIRAMYPDDFSEAGV